MSCDHSIVSELCQFLSPVSSLEHLCSQENRHPDASPLQSSVDEAFNGQAADCLPQVVHFKQGVYTEVAREFGPIIQHMKESWQAIEG